MTATMPSATPMPRPEDHPPAPIGRIGVLIVNLGTPAAPEPGAVRRYLRQFLSDRRVVEIPPLIWQPILNLFVLTTRPAKSAHAYRQIWGERGSPLMEHSLDQRSDLQQRLGGGVMVELAMRYGEPSIEQRLDRLKAAGCDRILIAPLYPQYSGATTATVIDAVGAALARMRWQPAIRTMPPYYDDPLHIAALADDLGGSLAALDFGPDVLLASFHGMPQRTLELGDPYHCQCRKTARLLADALGRPVMVSFQSRFGRAKWLEPATDRVLADLAASGVRRVAICSPGFSVDCLETLEELAIRGREQFLEAGGERFAYLPALNARPTGMAMLEALIRRELSGWIER